MDRGRELGVRMSDALAVFDSVGTIDVPPDPGVLKAIGLNHRLESAIADLVDNSLDAGATNVLVRFVVEDGRAQRLLVVDDGCGMSTDAVDAAMRLGRPKASAHSKLGHFGMGLKSASFSQAGEVTVLSRDGTGEAVGRRMRREQKSHSFEVEVLEPTQVEAALDEAWPGFATTTGTIVRWDRVRTFPLAKEASVTNRFLEKTREALQHHLGLMFHRLLARHDFSLGIDVYDLALGEAGFRFEVEPIDPFGYSRRGHPDYPKVLRAQIENATVNLECHIWPGRSDSPMFRLAGAPIDTFQGFYLYRNDRLLSAGNWGGVVEDSKRRRLARVAVDIEDHLEAFAMSVEKSGVRMVADLVHAIEQAESDDGTSFPDYLALAEAVFKDSNRRSNARTPVLPPGQGLSPRVKRAIERELDFVQGEVPLRIRWKRLAPGEFLEVDRREQTLWLSEVYREAMLKGTNAGVNDLPMVKALLYLLFEDVFRGIAVGPKDKDNIALWSEILYAAAEDEWHSYEC